METRGRGGNEARRILAGAAGLPCEDARARRASLHAPRDGRHAEQGSVRDAADQRGQPLGHAAPCPHGATPVPGDELLRWSGRGKAVIEPTNWWKTRLVTFIAEHTPKCHDVTRLISESLDRPLPLR